MANPTWQQLNDYIQQQYAAQYDPSQSVGLDPSSTSVPDWQSQFGKSYSGEGTDTSFGANGFQLPGQQGTWTWDPNNQQFLQQQSSADPQGVAGYYTDSYNRLKQGADGSVASDNAYAARRNMYEGDGPGWFSKHMEQIVIAGIGAIAGGALSGAAAGVGGAAADAGAATGAGTGSTAGTGAGWVSAEGGAGYAGGAAADASALGAGTTSGVSGTAGTGASGGAETPGWTSAEGGSGYSGGAPTDGGAGTIGGAPVTSNPVANPGSIYGGTTTPPTSGIPWGQVAQTAVPIVGGLINANSASNALAAQVAAGQQADATQRYFYDTNRADNAPFLKNGTAASNALAGGIGIGPATAGGPASGSLTRQFTTADFNADPVNQLAFQYGMDQGTQGINRQASATGGLDSGAVLKALTRFGTDYGNTKASESYNRFTTNQDSQYNKLAGVAGSGQVASAQVGAAGTNAGNQISQNQTAVGNARGASAIATGNALSGGLTGAYNNYQNGQLINALSQRGSNSNPYGYTTSSWNDPGASYNGWTSQG